jgi:hypothetical protein
LILEDVRHKVIERDIDYGMIEWGVCKEIQTYQFLTPWLPLNEKNYQKYFKASHEDKRALLKRILVGNLLSASKALGCNITEHISVKELNIVKVNGVFLKGVPFVGFWGNFAVNFHIPTYWGLGKSASRGFGSIQPEHFQI